MATFLIACGGTGGHLAPGIAVAEELQQRGHTCKLLVSRKDVDGRLAAKYETLEFIKTPGRPLSFRPLGLTAFVWSQLHAVLFSLKLMRERPRSVIAFGGFTSAGVVVAASLRGVPIALHEANRKVGRAVRLLKGLASRVYLPDGIHMHNVPMRFIRYHGYPVRKEIRNIQKDAARRALDLPTEGKLLVIVGGSQGAASLNQWARTHMQVLYENGINLCCITGAGKGGPTEQTFRDSSGVVTKALFLPFCDRMSELLSAADVAVSRAGAGSIAEFTECMVPSILVPYPHAADNHQEENASFHEKQAAALILHQSKLDDLYAEVVDLIFNHWLLDRMAFNLRQLRRTDSATLIATDLENLLPRPRRPFAPQRSPSRVRQQG